MFRLQIRAKSPRGLPQPLNRMTSGCELKTAIEKHETMFVLKTRNHANTTQQAFFP